MLSLIVAISENAVIGRDGELPWRLSADLRRFKRLTMGHHIVMGRKTFESIGRLLPGRKMIVVTRREEYKPAGVIVARDLSAAIEAAAGDDEVFVIGGGEIYRQAIEMADRIYLTRVHAEVEGDVTFPEIDWSQWRNLEETHHAADAKNQFAHTFAVLTRRQREVAGG